MKKLLLRMGLFSMVLIFLLAVPGTAQEKATPDECVAKCKEAAKMIQEVGLDTALAKMNNKQGPFVWKDSYVCCIHLESGKMLAQPYFPNAVGTEMKFITDPNGKLYIAEMIELAETKGEGWVSYMFQRPGGPGQLRPKSAYVLKVPNEKVLVTAGYYE
jgi:signal transduction histidine kinase